MVQFVTGQFILFAIWFLVHAEPVIAADISKKRLFGFDVTRHSIPLEEIESGGPPKDGIPAILKPKFLKASNATYLLPEDRVLGIVIGGEARAYPVKILNWHEIVNDRIEGRGVVITYCPLCGTGMAFNAEIEGKLYTFGVSGLLYNSDVLLYDHQTESLWSQIKQEAVAGPMTGARLVLLPLIYTSWDKWRSEYPSTLVLSDDTGYHRDYSRDPYAGYGKSSEIRFNVSKRDGRFHPKELVIGAIVDGVAKAYPFSRLRNSDGPLDDRIGKIPVRVHFDKKSNSAFIKDSEGNILPSVVGYWFAWYAFYPETLVY